jgi:hypothetical protein
VGLFYSIIQLSIMPTVIIPDKICPHCGGDKWFQSSNKSRSKYKDKDKIFIRYICFILRTEGINRWKKNNPEKVKAIKKAHKDKDPERTKKLESSYKRTYYQKYTDKLKAKVSKWQMANSERNKEIHTKALKKYNRKHVDNLSEKYVKKLITNYTPLKPSDINQELVELKRKSIKLQRQLKQKTCQK